MGEKFIEREKKLSSVVYLFITCEKKTMDIFKILK